MVGVRKALDGLSQAKLRDQRQHQELNKVFSKSLPMLLAVFLGFSLILFFHGIPMLADLIAAQIPGAPLQEVIPSMIGMDYYINFQGSLAAFAFKGQALNPYVNQDVLTAITQGKLPTLDPGLFTEAYLAHFSGDDLDRGQFGFVSSPVVAWMLRGLYSFGGSGAFLFNAWVLATFSVFVGVISLFLRGLMSHDIDGRRQAPPLLRFVPALLSAVGLLVIFYKNAAVSIQLGQIDAMYLAPLALTVYLTAFHPHSKKGQWISGLALAVATGVKVFPILLAGYFVIQMVAQVFYRRHQDPPPRFRDFPAVRVLSSTALGLAALVGVTWGTLGGHLFSQWVSKVALFLDLKYSSLTLIPNARQYLTYVGDWMAAFFQWKSVPEFLNPQFTWPLLVGMVSALIAVTLFRHPSEPTSARRRVLEMSLLLAALATLMPHFWHYYEVVYFIPFLVTWISAFQPRTERRWLRWALPTLLVVAYSLLNLNVLDVMDLVIPHLKEGWLVPWAQTPFTPPPAAQILGPAWGSIPTPYSMFLGYPGSVVLFLSVWLALIDATNDRRFWDFPQRWRDFFSRRSSTSNPALQLFSLAA